ncbi:DUF2892 domain-containing protein [Flavobacteriaceae bacterium]|nr:DUF2892 domain-containing protein [Flavobacteriaceae bacterium]
MFNKNFKIVLFILAIAYAIYQFTESYIGNGIMFIFIGLIFLFLYFKNELILKLRKQDFEGTERWLNKIKNPKTALTQKQQGYYNFLKGIMVSQTNMTAAEKFFKNAVSLGLSMDHDMAMAKLNLAGIAFTKRRKQEAQRLLKEAQTLDKRDMLSEQIRMMKQQMKKASIPNQHYGQTRGGRRR